MCFRTRMGPWHSTSQGGLTQGFSAILPASSSVGWAMPTHAGSLPASCSSAVASAKWCHGSQFARRSWAQPLPAMLLPKANWEPVPLGETPVPGRWWRGGDFPHARAGSGGACLSQLGCATSDLTMLGSFESTRGANLNSKGLIFPNHSQCPC